MLSESLQRNAKHEARLSNIFDFALFLASAEMFHGSFAHAQDDSVPD
jgi:hypothetical protein